MHQEACNNRHDWSDTAPWDEVRQRAAGRRHYNAVRRFRALFRRRRLAALMLVHGRLRVTVKGGLTNRGVQARLARELGVSRSTICRDLAFLLREARASADAGPTKGNGNAS